MEKGKKLLLYSALFIVSIYFLFMGLIYAQEFLAPLLLAMVMALLVLPINYKLESWGLPKALSTLATTLLLLIVTLGFAAIVVFQIKSFADDWEQMKENLEETYEEFSAYLVERTPIEQEQIDGMRPDGGQEDEQEENEGEGQNPNSANSEDQNENEEEEDENEEGAGDQAMTALGAAMGFLVDFLITFVYVFLFIHFRGRFKEFLLRLFPKERRKKVADIIYQAATVSRSYLAGRLFLMIILAILYYAGLLISGLENAILVSLIAAALSLIPFVGNFIGYFIALALGLLSDGDTGMLIGITATFMIAQFIDSYILQPIVLGDKLNVHPFFIILSVILGNAMWGIMGMVLSIPIFGIITVICRQVPILNPFGYLFSKTDVEEPEDKDRFI
jgi:predicted PurR-regulated permease PerM